MSDDAPNEIELLADMVESGAALIDADGICHPIAQAHIHHKPNLFIWSDYGFHGGDAHRHHVHHIEYEWLDIRYRFRTPFLVFGVGRDVVAMVVDSVGLDGIVVASYHRARGAWVDATAADVIAEEFRNEVNRKVVLYGGVPEND